MSLNVLNKLKSSIPSYTITLPFSKTKVTYRPYLVKEEKVLLLAMEQDDDQQIVDAMKNLIESCTSDIKDAGDIPLLDFEYLFMHIRAKSVSEKAAPTFKDPETDEKITLDIDIEEIKPKLPKDFSDTIMLTDDVGITLRPPTLNMTSLDTLTKYSMNIEDVFDLLRKCLVSIFTKDEITKIEDLTDEELNEFLDLLTGSQFESISKYFDQIPELEHTVTYTRQDGEERTIILKGLNNFFN